MRDPGTIAWPAPSIGLMKLPAKGAAPAQSLTFIGTSESARFRLEVDAFIAGDYLAGLRLPTFLPPQIASGERSVSPRSRLSISLQHMAA